MIYQPRKGKTALFERRLKVVAHLVPSERTMVFYYQCLCQSSGRTFVVVKILGALLPSRHHQTFENRYEPMARNARLN